MNHDQEIEIKFHLADLPAFARRLQEKGARLETPRTREINLRFDTPARELARDHRVLRLRQDHDAHLTYKGPADPTLPVTVRQEIEFKVSDFASARRLLEALGYEVSVTYEKFRTVYFLENTEVSLDEMPFGNFCEIEGADVPSVQAVSGLLGLKWETRILESYLALFNRLRTHFHLTAQNLTFAELAGAEFSLDGIGLKPADR